MEQILEGYRVNLPTWFYLSLLLIVAVYFRFHRVFSIRNVDLILLLSLSPGLLLVESEPSWGYGYLFAVSSLLLVRLFCDGLLQRRPRLEQNLNLPGLCFLGIAAFVFLTTRAITEELPYSAIATTRGGDQLLQRQDASSEFAEGGQPGPAIKLLAAPAVALGKGVAANGAAHDKPVVIEEIAPRVLAVLSHLAVVVGLVVLGRMHFGDLQIGVAMATMYLLLPCTAYDVGQVNQVLPAALILWAFVAYRRPMVAGTLMGLACGTLFFPLFLLPLWAAFYDQRGALRFTLALAIVAAVLLGSLVLTSADANSFTRQIIGSIDWNLLLFYGGGSEGFWGVHNEPYRIPVFVTFVLLLVVLTFWPRDKTLEHLISHSAAIVLATQFWYSRQGGVYLLWYLPLMLLVVFRPRLTQHVAPDMTGTRLASKPAEKPSRRQFTPSSATTGHFFR